MKRLENTIWLWRRSRRPLASADQGLFEANAWLGAVGTDVPLVVDGRAWNTPELPVLGEEATDEQVAEALEQLGATGLAPPPLLEMLNSARNRLHLSSPLLAALDNPWSLVRSVLGRHLASAGRSQGELLARTVEDLSHAVAAAAGLLAGCDADGVVLCVSDDGWSRAMRGADYDELVCKGDQAALSAVASSGKLRILQILEVPQDFQRFARYPVDAIAWADRRHPPSLAYARDRVEPALIGGLDAYVLLGGNAKAIHTQADDARRQVGGHPLVVGVGEPLPTTPHGVRM